eukprot:UN04695
MEVTLEKRMITFPKSLLGTSRRRSYFNSSIYASMKEKKQHIPIIIAIVLYSGALCVPMAKSIPTRTQRRIDS